MDIETQKRILVAELDVEESELFYRETFMVSDLNTGKSFNQRGWYFVPFGEQERFLGQTAESILSRY